MTQSQNCHRRTMSLILKAAVLSLPVLFLPLAARAQTDPGVRGGPTAAGGPLAGLDNRQARIFQDGQTRFAQADSVSTGLGPRLNMTSCAGCHASPASG